MRDLGAVGEHVRAVFLALAPPVLEEPRLGELAGVGERFDGETADVVDGFVELGDLGAGEGVAVLLRVNLGVVEDFVTMGEG